MASWRSASSTGGGYGIEHRIERTLHGLGFNESQYSRPMVQLGGGQKTRAALAATLLSDPDLLLLDEAANHLDLVALEWLERFLKDWEGTLIVISHDRYFLDHVTGRTLDMAFGRLEDYPAGYQKYMALKAVLLELQIGTSRPSRTISPRPRSLSGASGWPLQQREPAAAKDPQPPQIRPAGAKRRMDRPAYLPP